MLQGWKHFYEMREEAETEHNFSADQMPRVGWDVVQTLFSKGTHCYCFTRKLQAPLACGGSLSSRVLIPAP